MRCQWCGPLHAVTSVTFVFVLAAAFCLNLEQIAFFVVIAIVSANSLMNVAQQSVDTMHSSVRYWING